MRVTTTTINGIEYSRDNSEAVFLVPVSQLDNFCVKHLPNNSSLHPTEIDLNDIELYFSVTNGNSPGKTEPDGYSIFLYLSVKAEEYQEGSKRIHQVVNAIFTISTQQFLDTPRIGVDQVENKLWRHYVTYMIDGETAENILIKDLAYQLSTAINNMQPDIQIFLCHSSEDKPIVEQFAYRLKSLKTFVWFDKWEIKIGDSIVEKINDGLGKMTHLIIFLSKSSVDKPWVKKELSTALMRKLSDNSVRLMPVKIDDVIVPPIINDIKYADCSDDLESGFNHLLNDIIN